MRRVLAATLVMLGVCTCAETPPAVLPPPTMALVAGAADAARDAGANAASLACTDFYAYACNDWLASHPLPPDASYWSLYDEITKKNRATVQAILEETSRPGAATPDRPSMLVGGYYAACMDEEKIESRGLSPLAADLALIASIRTREDLLRVMAALSRRGIDSVIELSAEQDADDATRVMADVDRKPFPLQVRDNYVAETDRAKGLRAAYEAYLTRIFEGLGGKATAAADGKRVLALEVALAKASRTEVARRDPKGRHNPIDLDKQAPTTFAFRQYLDLLGAKNVKNVNVEDPDYFVGLAHELATAELPSWRAYLRARLVRVMHAVMPRAFVQADFDFFRGTLRGEKEIAPRWKRCADMVDRDIGEALGQLFVARAFPAENKAKALRLVDALREALREELVTAPWMTEPTRRAALEKLAAVRVKIGYPEQFRDYATLTIARDDAFGNSERAIAVERARQLAKIGRPVERDEWFELPQTLDAYGTNSLNEVAFTAGFLQPPLFDPDADVATMFGSLGAVIGHELTHRFDDSGRNYDAAGNLRQVWTQEDADQYASRAACFEKQYASYTEFGEHVDGKLTLGENIADNGGLRLAYRAAHLDALTDPQAAQRFFVAWARIRCANITEATARARLRGDPHSPGRWRAIGAVSNMPEFAQAFGCDPSTPMKNDPICRLW